MPTRDELFKAEVRILDAHRHLVLATAYLAREWDAEMLAAQAIQDIARAADLLGYRMVSKRGEVGASEEEKSNDAAAEAKLHRDDSAEDLERRRGDVPGRSAASGRTV